MASAINDRLQKTLNGLNVDSRLSTWLWLFLKSQAPHANLGELGSPAMRDRMADIIQNTQLNAELIEAQSALFLAVAEAECNTVTGLKQVHHAATPLPLS